MTRFTQHLMPLTCTFWGKLHKVGQIVFAITIIFDSL